MAVRSGDSSLYPAGGSTDLSVPDDDDRAGSDVEEIEARAREQERLLSAGGEDGATGEKSSSGRWRAGGSHSLTARRGAVQGWGSPF